MIVHDSIELVGIPVLVDQGRDHPVDGARGVIERARPRRRSRPRLRAGSSSRPPISRRRTRGRTTRARSGESRIDPGVLLLEVEALLPVGVAARDRRAGTRERGPVLHRALASPLVAVQALGLVTPTLAGARFPRRSLCGSPQRMQIMSTPSGPHVRTRGWFRRQAVRPHARWSARRPRSPQVCRQTTPGRGGQRRYDPSPLRRREWAPATLSLESARADSSGSAG